MAYNSINNVSQTENQLVNIDTNQNKKSQWHWLKIMIVCIIKLILGIIAVYLSWTCNVKTNIILRIIIAIVSLLFSELYIFYYGIYRVFMGNKCAI